MDTLVQLLEMVLHIDKHLGVFIDQYGNWVYLFLFMIVFVETGLVLFPFLPGDSLLFIGGAFAATGAMDPWLLGALLFIAAVTGNTLNYWIGWKIGPRVYEKNWRFLDRDALRKTHDFYEHHGGKTIVMARFVPVVRTFAPFVAGVSAMSWARVWRPPFTGFSPATAASWKGSCRRRRRTGSWPCWRRGGCTDAWACGSACGAGPESER